MSTGLLPMLLKSVVDVATTSGWLTPPLMYPADQEPYRATQATPARKAASVLCAKREERVTPGPVTCRDAITCTSGPGVALGTAPWLAVADAGSEYTGDPCWVGVPVADAGTGEDDSDVVVDSDEETDGDTLALVLGMVPLLVVAVGLALSEDVALVLGSVPLLADTVGEGVEEAAMLGDPLSDDDTLVEPDTDIEPVAMLDIEVEVLTEADGDTGDCDGESVADGDSPLVGETDGVTDDDAVALELLDELDEFVALDEGDDDVELLG